MDMITSHFKTMYFWSIACYVMLSVLSRLYFGYTTQPIVFLSHLESPENGVPNCAKSKTDNECAVARNILLVTGLILYYMP